MKRLLTLLGIGVAHYALANAKVMVSAILETEQVQAVIQGDSAAVSGKFRFRRFSLPDRNARDEGQVYFPLICAKENHSTLAALDFRLKLNGKEATSYSIATNPPVAVPASDAYEIIWILAKAPVDAIRGWEVEVCYRQKLLNGVFYYLPILGQARPSAEAFQICVKADRPIRSVGNEGGGVIAKGPRELLFMPANLRMIQVAADAKVKSQ